MPPEKIISCYYTQMHPKLDLPNIKLLASNALFCGKCGQPLAVTHEGKNYGLLGIQAVIEEESRCAGKQTVRLVNVRKKPGALFAK